MKESDKTFIFTRPLGQYTDLPRKRVYPLVVPGMDTAEYLTNVQALIEFVKVWYDTEVALKPTNVSETEFLPSIISQLNLKIIATPDSEYQENFIKILRDTGTSSSMSRLLDLSVKLSYVLPFDFLEAVKGNIYANVCNFGSAIEGVPSKLDWYEFTERFKFAWLLFVIQDHVRMAKA